MAGVSIGDIRSRRISGSAYAIVWGFGHVAVLLLSPPIRLKKEWEVFLWLPLICATFIPFIMKMHG